MSVSSDQFDVLILPDRGASIARCVWRRPDGAFIDLMRIAREEDIQDLSGSLSKLSSFVMAPFANRIDGARFAYDGVEHALPLNRPQQACAIHGFSRDRAWTLIDAGPRVLAFEDVFAEPTVPYRYRLAQRVEIVDDAPDVEAVVVTLEIENQGDAAMPFGFGHHPWFVRDAETTLRFAARTTFDGDDRTFPVAARPVEADVGFDEATRIVDRLGTDRHFAGWAGTATIAQPSAGYALTIAGGGAFKNLHVYCPVDQDLFCVEPVSHVTDVVNRRAFAAYGDMARLGPGERLTGSMTLRPTAL